MIGLIALLALGGLGVYEYEKTYAKGTNPWTLIKTGESAALVKGQDATVRVANGDSGKVVSIGVQVVGLPSDTPSKKYTLLVTSFDSDVAPAGYGVGTLFETTREFIFDSTKGPQR